MRPRQSDDRKPCSRPFSSTRSLSHALWPGRLAAWIVRASSV